MSKPHHFFTKVVDNIIIFHVICEKLAGHKYWARYYKNKSGKKIQEIYLGKFLQKMFKPFDQTYIIPKVSNTYVFITKVLDNIITSHTICEKLDGNKYWARYYKKQKCYTVHRNRVSWPINKNTKSVHNSYFFHQSDR